MNLLQETLDSLDLNGKTPIDVEWVGLDGHDLVFVRRNRQRPKLRCWLRL